MIVFYHLKNSFFKSLTGAVLINIIENNKHVKKYINLNSIIWKKNEDRNNIFWANKILKFIINFSINFTFKIKDKIDLNKIV